ncbi:MAG: efflux RND transporter periplasmic adaptor subunit [Deltaproteobacteria bacterium]|nr:efflux RND transporter periplasmic adaptor subunit [Deltaproteobacteria bacterium]
MKRFFMPMFLGAAIFAAPLILTGCGEKVGPGTAEVKRQEVTGIKVAQIQTSESTESLEISGSVKAKSISSVASKAMGTVTSINVAEGDRVKKGALLMTIDDSDIAQKVKGAEAGKQEALRGLEATRQQMLLMDSTYERYKKLYDQKAVSQQEFDTITTQRNAARLDYERMQESIKRAEAGVSEARVYRGYAKITSPVSGVVTEKKIDVGSMASPGMPLLTIEDTSSYTLEVNVDERLLDKIKTGMPVEVTIDSLGRDIQGRISEIVPSINPASRTFLVKISLKDEGLRTGLYGRVKFPGDKKTVLAVPKSSIISKGQLTGVYTVDEKNVLTYRLVRLGSSDGDNIEILSGLNPGEKIIIEGAEKAADGAVVK